MIQAAHSPADGTIRRQIQAWSVPILRKVSLLPRLVPLGIALVLMATGLIIPAPLGALGPALLAVVAAWLLYLGWPGLRWPERLGRMSITMLAAAIALVLAVPR